MTSVLFLETLRAKVREHVDYFAAQGVDATLSPAAVLRWIDEIEAASVVPEGERVTMRRWVGSGFGEDGSLPHGEWKPVDRVKWNGNHEVAEFVRVPPVASSSRPEGEREPDCGAIANGHVCREVDRHRGPHDDLNGHRWWSESTPIGESGDAEGGLLS